ncbi:hypothetical protein C0J52_09988 [Blattella germanica]|nr:hypothetical protein C0J52_09988 [Blattella germanica]
MKLLQHSWSDMLVLDHMHQRMHNNLPDETTLPNGQKFDLLCLGLLGVPTLADHFSDLMAKLQDLKFDVTDYICHLERALGSRHHEPEARAGRLRSSATGTHGLHSQLLPSNPELLTKSAGVGGRSLKSRVGSNQFVQPHHHVGAATVVIGVGLWQRSRCSGGALVTKCARSQCGQDGHYASYL